MCIRDRYKDMQEEIESIISSRRPEIKEEVQKIANSLYNLPANTSTDKILHIFKQNLEKLKLCMYKEEVKIVKSNALEELKNYSGHFKDQVAKIKECNAKKSLGQHEFEGIWKLIDSNKKLLEENKKIIVSSLL
eukprot:TRINITY_DN7971_c0_g1_i1.p1 TRINITY_DN7971_c0_g1~~TRINITY_DN7971_c0_g1_i1.p1  ORF type:complete len:134 (-),score=29.70 TRINITY_DN7971_c0_g1_i1:135-536(-)